MSIDRPEPGAEIHDGPPTVPRLAATVILLRGGSSSLEVLLVRRNPAARFMGGAWVFPGGAVDAADGDGQAGLQAGARRELAEEAGVVLPAEIELVSFARWITPAAVRTRFDTWFYLATAPPGAEAKVDGEEIVDARWIAPREALAQQQTGELQLVFPTIRQLQQLAEFSSANELLEHRRGRTVEPVQPRIVGEGAAARLVIPGDAGYE